MAAAGNRLDRISGVSQATRREIHARRAGEIRPSEPAPRDIFGTRSTGVEPVGSIKIPDMQGKDGRPRLDSNLRPCGLEVADLQGFLASLGRVYTR
jgi:hypothetical protein